MNNSIFYFFYNLAHQSSIADKLIVFLAVYFPYIVIILAGLFLLFHHEVFKASSPYRVFLQKKKEILFVFATGVCAWIIAYLLKFLIHIPRPFDMFPPCVNQICPQDLWHVYSLIPESGFSFPSGHATFYMALAMSIYFLHKKAGYWFMAFAFIIGLARIIAGVHFPIDILGGFMLGGIVAYFVKKI
jgi:membrane-associated phospholipid phosphatase